jgi:hypothetical protein
VARLGLSKRAVHTARHSRIADPGDALVRERLALLRSFRWSSYAAYVQTRSAPGWLTTATVLDMGGGPAANRRGAYREYVEAQIRQGNMVSPWESLQESVVLGAKAFVSRLRGIMPGVASGHAPSAQWVPNTVTFEEVVSAIEKARGERWLDFRDRHGDGGRDLLLDMARRATNLTLAQLAEAAGLKGPAQVAVAIQRHQARLKKSASDRRIEQQAATSLGLRPVLCKRTTSLF